MATVVATLHFATKILIFFCWATKILIFHNSASMGCFYVKVVSMLAYHFSIAGQVMVNLVGSSQ